MFFVYRYILRESCSQFDSLPLTYLTYARRQECDALATRRAVFAREEREEREREKQFATAEQVSAGGARQSKGRAKKKKGARR